MGGSVYMGAGYEDEPIKDKKTLRLLRGAFGYFNDYSGTGLLLHMEENHQARRKFHDLFIEENIAESLLEELGETKTKAIQPRDITAYFNAYKRVVAVAAG